ncbi:MAG: acyl-CoA dehydrogenase family protein [Pseudomonadales bacterium]
MSDAAWAFSVEQNQFREMVSGFLSTRSPIARVRELIASGQSLDRLLWLALARELGAQGVHVPERAGGSGFGAVELGIVMEEMGRHLFPGVFLSSAVLATTALLAVQGDSAEEALTGLAIGERVGALLLDSLDDPALLGCTLSVSASARLNGIAPLVPGAADADLWLAIARDEVSAELGLYRVLRAPVCQVLTPLDLTRPIARVIATDLPCVRLGVLDAGTCARLWDEWNVALAHELVGAAEALLAGTLDYLKVRVQFGRVIGSFQALKHRCADVLMEVELAKALAREAARTIDAGHPARAGASMAKSQAADAAMQAARAAIQLRGGLGFTWENDTHLWFRRVKSAEMLFGSPAQHREWLMAHLEETV